MDSQWRLFRTKAFSDFSVLVSLLLTLALPGIPGPCTLIPSPPSSSPVSLLFLRVPVITSSLPDLLDKTLDEDLRW